MVANANPLPVTAPGSVHERFIAADVGGTHVRIGLVEGSDDPAHPVAVLQYRKYVCAQYPGLTEIIEEFLGTLTGETVSRGVIASAGYPLEDGTVITANLPWRLSPAEIRERLGFREIRLSFDLDTDASDEQIATLVKLTERYCVIFQTLNKPPKLGLVVNKV